MVPHRMKLFEKPSCRPILTWQLIASCRFPGKAGDESDDIDSSYTAKS